MAEEGLRTTGVLVESFSTLGSIFGSIGSRVEQALACIMSTWNESVGGDPGISTWIHEGQAERELSLGCKLSRVTSARGTSGGAKAIPDCV